MGLGLRLIYQIDVVAVKTERLCNRYTEHIDRPADKKYISFISPGKQSHS